MPTAALPADWAALGRFAESGGTCRLRIRLPGGMDPATLLGQVRLSDDTVNGEELEAEFTRVQSGAAKHALANPCTAPALGQPQAGGVAALGLP